MNGNLCVVLRAADYKDNHKMVTLFSREEGKISVMVPGAKSLKNGFAAATQPLSCGIAIFEEKQGRKYLKQFDLKKSYYAISEKYDAYVAACELIRFTEKVLTVIDDFNSMFIIFVNAVDALMKGVSSEQVKNFFILKFLDFFGMSPELDTCVLCGVDIENAKYFSVSEGGVVCADCATYGEPLPFSESTRQMMKKVLQIKPVDFNGYAGLEGDITGLISSCLSYMTELSL